MAMRPTTRRTRAFLRDGEDAIDARRLDGVVEGGRGRAPRHDRNGLWRRRRRRAFPQLLQRRP
jgi:hypothetical protein